jgi:iron complex transport system substrate-binding protein
MPKTPPTRARDLVRSLALLAACALLAVACGDGDDRTATAAAGSDPAADAGEVEPGAFPVTIENCGRAQTFDAPPERAVTMNQHVTEILLALGLADRMVGTAYMDSEIHPDLADAYRQVEVLAEKYPTREQVLATEPDLVVGGFASAFGDTAAGDRDALEALGIGTYLTETYCPDREGPAALDLVEADIDALGAVFGVPDRADALSAELRAEIDAVREATAGAEPVRVFVYDSGDERAFTAAGFEMTTYLIEAAGGRNVFDDVEAAFTEVSWEDVVDRDPDVVVILDYGDVTVAEKKDLLRTHPVASSLRAVQEERFVVIELTDVVPGIRNGAAVELLGAGFHPDLVTPG